MLHLYNGLFIILVWCLRMSTGGAIAYVLINAEIGSEREILEELKSIPEIEEAYLLYGVYDIIVKLRAEDNDKIREIMLTKIRQIRRIRSTLTMLVVEGFERE